MTTTEGMANGNSARMSLREALKELKTREADYESFFENAPVGVFHSMPAGRLLRANVAMSRMLGYSSPGELVAAITDMRTQMYADPLKRPEIMAALERADGWLEVEVDLRGKDGASVPVEMKGRRVLRAGGELAYLEGFIVDVTKKKEWERKLLETDERWRALAESTGTVLVDNDLEKGLLRFSAGWKGMLGYADEEVGSVQTIEEWEARIHPDDIERTRECIQAFVDEVTPPPSWEHRVRCKDGQWKWVLASGMVARRAPDGRPLRVAGVLTDITARRHVESMKDAAYRISEAAHDTANLDDFFERTHAILGEVMPARNFYIALLDAATGILDFPYFVDEFDAAPAPKPAGRGLTEFLIRTGKPLLASREDLEDLVARGEVEVHGTFPFRWLGSPLEVSGVTIGAVVVQSYATEARFTRSDMDFLAFLSGQVATSMDRKRAEQELRTLYAELGQRVVERTAELTEANRELEAFSYSISHELRTPLRAIDGFSARVSDAYAGLLDDEGRRLFGEVRWNAQRMGRLIDDLLEFSRVGHVDLAFGPVNMTGAAKAAFALIVPEAESRSRISLSVDDLPEATGNARFLSRVWETVLSNAVKFSGGREKPEIHVEGSIQGDEVVYRVRDNGVGFDMKYVDKLFGVFHRLHGHREFEGTGVGLSLVRRIVVRHGGRVWAEGELDRGATFSFSLPVKS